MAPSDLLRPTILQRQPGSFKCCQLKWTEQALTTGHSHQCFHMNYGSNFEHQRQEYCDPNLLCKFKVQRNHFAFFLARAWRRMQQLMFIICLIVTGASACNQCRSGTYISVTGTSAHKYLSHMLCKSVTKRQWHDNPQKHDLETWQLSLYSGWAYIYIIRILERAHIFVMTPHASVGLYFTRNMTHRNGWRTMF